MPPGPLVSPKSDELQESAPLLVNEGEREAAQTRPVRVLHLIADLGGGGSERLLWDIVRLSKTDNFKHQVMTVYPESSGDFIYADRLQQSGAYRQESRNSLFGVPGKIVRALKARRRRLPLRGALIAALRFGSIGLATLRVGRAVNQFRPDVIHVHTLPGFIPGVLMKKVFHTPLIHTVPGVFSQMVDAGYGWMPKLYARLHPHVDSFFTGASRAELLAVGVPAPKIHDIRGVVDLEALDTVQAERGRHYREVRQALGLSEDARIALSVGRLHPSKGHDYALEALPRLLDQFPNLHWVVLGEGAERAALESRTKALGVAGHVHLIGFRPDPLPYYAAADIYLRTPVFEAENLSSYQAMASGLPVVGFDTGNETELIRKAGHGHLVANRDAAALADGVARILSSPDRGRALGRLGAEYCRRHLDIRQTISEISAAYVELYEKTVNRES
jgi:glycosyltransferase involved in cell wall biosynthesis